MAKHGFPCGIEPHHPGSKDIEVWQFLLVPMMVYFVNGASDLKPDF